MMRHCRVLTGLFLRNGQKIQCHRLHTGKILCTKTPETKMVERIRSRIKMNGPITVADYMRDVLTNPDGGYYMHKDVFGTKGDFTTSPEISQMFGELIGLWGIYEWMQLGLPSPLHIVELGPGRGTLADDILRIFPMIFNKMEDLEQSVSYHMVEISPKLSEMQQVKVSGKPVDKPTDEKSSQEDAKAESANSQLGAETSYYRHCKSKYGPEVFWYDNLAKVPNGFTFFIAHEFFDALPIHKFQKRDNSWHEVLIDNNTSPDGDHFRYVLSREPTPTMEILLDVKDSDPRDHIELCPDAGIIVQDIATRLYKHGGFALIADYGHFGERGHTFRAFRNHEVFEPLQEPGTADLTADVDFSFLKEAAGEKVTCHGPVTQEAFLKNMGIELRLKMLLQNATKEQKKDLISGYDTLTNPKVMGERFKFFAMLNQKNKDYVPGGIVPPDQHKTTADLKK